MAGVRTVLPDINAQNGLVAGVARTHHEGVVLVGCGLDGQRAVPGHCQPGPSYTMHSNCQTIDDKIMEEARK